MPGLAAEAKRALTRLGASPRRRLGQNFMVDERDLAAIAEASGAAPGETVVEIGPGLGFLTRELVSRGARVTAVEADPKFAAGLRGLFGPAVAIVEKDILKTDLRRDLGISVPVRVAGNIPYNITSPILDWLVRQRPLVRSAVLTVQKEVAERLLAGPCTKAWGAVTAFVQYYFELKPVRRIARGHFWPAPNVDSAVVRLEVRARPAAETDDEEHFFGLIRRAFLKRRKTLLNALESASDARLSKPALSRAIARARLDPTRRPETLSLAEWASLSSAVRA